MVDGFKAITAGKAVIDWIKALNQYADEVKDTQKRGELMRIIGELNIKFAELQISFSELLQEKHHLKEEVNALKKEIDRLKSPTSKPIIRDGLYYMGDDGPFCTGCYDSKKDPIRLIKLPSSTSTIKRYKCPICDNPYTIDLEN